MKIKIVIFGMLLCLVKTYSQPVNSEPNRSGTTTKMAIFDFQNAQAQSLGMITGNSDVSKHFSNGSRNKMGLGATLLHNNWDNSGKVFTADKEFFFDSMDFDLYTGSLLIKMDNSIYSFSTDKVRKVIMNNVVYKVLYNPSAGNYQFFETVHNKDDFEILKGFKLVFKKGSEHVMFNTGQKNTLRRQEVYYTKNQNGLKRIKMSKKKIMKMLDSQNYDELLEKTGAKENRRVISND